MSRTGGPGPVYAAVPGDERALVAPMTQLRQHAEFGTGNRGATSAVCKPSCRKTAFRKRSR